MWPNGPKAVPKLSFLNHFLKFGSLVFLEIEYNDSLQQSLTCTGGKIHEKNLGAPNLSLKLGFLQFSQVWFISFP